MFEPRASLSIPEKMCSTPRIFKSSEEDCLTIRKGRFTDTELDARILMRLSRYGQGFSHLVELDLSFNFLTRFPQSLSQLSLLRHLNLSSNRLVVFPHEIASFTQLESLNISRNLLQGEFPKSYCTNLSRLKSLKLHENSITSIPLWIGSLEHLEVLTLGSSTGGNLIEYFPPGILPRLRKLRILDLSSNKLTSIPADVGFRDTRLEYLCIHDNQLSSIPKTIGLCQNLKSLDLSKNLISFLPIEIVDLENLQSLDLSKNSLCVIPADITAFMKRTAMMLSGNPMMVHDESGMGAIGDFSTEAATRSGSVSPLEMKPQFSTRQLERRLKELRLDSPEITSPKLSQEEPTESAPSLRELAARVVLSESIPVDPRYIPRSVLRALDSGARPCGYCNQPYVSEFLERVEFRSCHGHPSLPTTVAYCSPKCSYLSAPGSPSIADFRSKASTLGYCSTSGTHCVARDSPARGSVTPRSWKPLHVPPRKHCKISPLKSKVVPVSDLSMVDSLNDW
ncbi:hypothetical protein DSO57_1003311 [Entomophthora muscae]|uniref:Uncharacterized protein n=1 Tax=Entomophthora muscae TaxID=34485 RepID=A0ACC2T8F3_9FUNG|nr:hypothetical protein DSO57_1003311 [Entomophthora muscae]